MTHLREGAYEVGSRQEERPRGGGRLAAPRRLGPLLGSFAAETPTQAAGVSTCKTSDACTAGEPAGVLDADHRAPHLCALPQRPHQRCASIVEHGGLVGGQPAKDGSSGVKMTAPEAAC